MSLVHQALRKAQQEKIRKTGLTVPGETFAIAPPAPGALTGHLAAGSRAVPVKAPVVVDTGDAKPSATLTGLLPVLLSSVAFVAMVAIVFMVLRTTTAPRDATTATASPSANHSRDPDFAARNTISPTTPAAESIAATAPSVAQPARLPTQPAPPSDDSQFKLTGITPLPGGGAAAIINGRVVQLDQYVDGAIVKKIERDRVTLDVNGRTVVKRLF